MEEIRFRERRPEDLQALREISRCCFGDPPEQADPYIQDREGLGIRCLVAEREGRAVSAVYLRPGVRFIHPSGREVSAAYLYGLGTLPGERGWGYGIALLRKICGEALKTADWACGAVFEEGLKGIYRRVAKMEPLGRCRETELRRAELPEGPGEGALRELSPQAYAAAREEFLRGRAHAVYAPGFWRLAAGYGARFLQGPGILAMAEPREQKCLDFELLTEGTAFRPAAAAVAAALPAERYLIRTPLFQEGEGEIREYLLRLGTKTPEEAPEETFWFPMMLE